MDFTLSCEQNKRKREQSCIKSFRFSCDMILSNKKDILLWKRRLWIRVTIKLFNVTQVDRMECSNPLPQKPLSTMSHDPLCRGNIKLTQVSQHILCALKSNWQIGKFQDHWYWFQFKIINSFQEWMENVPSSGMGIFYTGLNANNI